jgi:hypothetical protein
MRWSWISLDKIERGDTRDQSALEDFWPVAPWQNAVTRGGKELRAGDKRLGIVSIESAKHVGP